MRRSRFLGRRFRRAVARPMKASARRPLRTPNPQPRHGAAVFVIADQRVAVANTEEGGLVCSFTVAGQKVSISDVATGVDQVGKISASRLIEVQRRTFLATIQTFRGGSNSARESHVLYAVESGKIHKALEIASLEELAIGGHRLSERNRLTPRADGLHVEQDLEVRRASARGNEALYRASRRFVLAFAPEFRSFVEGTGECVQDLVIGKSVWLKSGQRFGYMFKPGMADAAALSLKLIRADGTEAGLEDAADSRVPPVGQEIGRRGPSVRGRSRTLRGLRAHASGRVSTGSPDGDGRLHLPDPRRHGLDVVVGRERHAPGGPVEPVVHPPRPSEAAVRTVDSHV